MAAALGSARLAFEDGSGSGQHGDRKGQRDKDLGTQSALC